MLVSSVISNAVYRIVMLSKIKLLFEKKIIIQEKKVGLLYVEPMN